jgi:hypothetical protein
LSTHDFYQITAASHCTSCKKDALTHIGEWEHLEVPLDEERVAEFDFLVPKYKCRSCATEFVFSPMKSLMEDEASKWVAFAKAGLDPHGSVWH